MRITDAYLKLNEELHSRAAHYGSGGHRWSGQVNSLIGKYKAKTVLDYGCGKGTIAKSLRGVTVYQYDPAIKEHASEPKPADVVVCTDVLEHIEPELLDNVLKHILGLTKKVAFFNISTRLDGEKLLSDGTNPHRIIWPGPQWRLTLEVAGFHIIMCEPARNRVEQTNVIAEPT